MEGANTPLQFPRNEGLSASLNGETATDLSDHAYQETVVSTDSRFTYDSEETIESFSPSKEDWMSDEEWDEMSHVFKKRGIQTSTLDSDIKDLFTENRVVGFLADFTGMVFQMYHTKGGVAKLIVINNYIRLQCDINLFFESLAAFEKFVRKFLNPTVPTGMADWLDSVLNEHELYRETEIYNNSVQFFSALAAIPYLHQCGLPNALQTVGAIDWTLFNKYKGKKDIPMLIHSCVKSLKKVVELSIDAFLTGKCKLAPGSFKGFQNRVKWLEENLNKRSLSPLDSMEVAAFDYDNVLMETCSVKEKVVKQYYQDDKFYRAIVQPMIKRLEKIEQICRTADGHKRLQPFNVFLSGKAGAGKTWISKACANIAMESLGFKNYDPDENSYFCDINKKFMDGYDSTVHPVVFIDEINSISEKYASIPEQAANMLSYLSEQTILTNQADVSKKDSVYYKAIVNVCMSNDYDFGAKKIFNTPEAFFRRGDVDVEITGIKEEYNTAGVIDSFKVRGAIDIVDLQFYTKVIGSGGKQARIEADVYVDNMQYIHLVPKGLKKVPENFTHVRSPSNRILFKLVQQNAKLHKQKWAIRKEVSNTIPKCEHDRYFCTICFPLDPPQDDIEPTGFKRRVLQLTNGTLGVDFPSVGILNLFPKWKFKLPIRSKSSRVLPRSHCKCEDCPACDLEPTGFFVKPERKFLLQRWGEWCLVCLRTTGFGTLTLFAKVGNFILPGIGLNFVSTFAKGKFIQYGKEMYKGLKSGNEYVEEWTIKAEDKIFGNFFNVRKYRGIIRGLEYLAGSVLLVKFLEFVYRKIFPNKKIFQNIPTGQSNTKMYHNENQPTGVTSDIGIFNGSPPALQYIGSDNPWRVKELSFELGRARGTPEEIIFKKVDRNCLMLNCQGDDGPILSHAFFICEQYALVVSHDAKRIIGKEVTLNKFIQLGDQKSWKIYCKSIIPEFAVLDLGNEISLVRFHNSISYSDIRNLFHKSIDFNKIKTLRGINPSFSPKGEFRVDRFVCSPMTRTYPVYGQLTTVFGVGGNGTVDSFFGRCGSPLILQHNKEFSISGINVAGKVGTPHNFYSVIDIDTIEGGIQILKDRDPLMSPVSTDYEDLGKIQGIELQPTSLSKFTHAFHRGHRGTNNYLARNPIVKRAGKSKVRSQPFQEEMFELIPEFKHDLIAPIFGGRFVNGEYKSPGAHALNDMSEPAGNFDLNVLSKIMDWMVRDKEKIEDFKHDTWLDDFSVLSGVAKNSLVPPIRKSTSAGPGFPGKKRDYFVSKPTDELPDGVVPGPYLASKLEELCVKYNNGQRGLPICKACEKDEPRKISKVEDAKIRIFTVSPLHSSIVMMRLTKMYQQIILKNFLHNGAETVGGVNVFGPQWGQICRKMTKHPWVINGDFKHYDKSFSIIMMLAVYTIRLRVKEKSGFFKRAMECVLTSMVDEAVKSGRAKVLKQLKEFWRAATSDNIFPIYEIDGDIVQAQGSNPSGQSNTFLDNDEGNSMLIRYCFAILFWGQYAHATIEDLALHWENNVALITLGDDNSIGVSEEVKEWFYFHSLRDELAKIGFIFTPADKSDNAPPVIPSSQFSIGKRTGVWDEHYQLWRAPLEKPSLGKMIGMYMDEPPLGRKEKAGLSMECAIQEIAQWGEEYYNSRVPILVDLARRHDILIPRILTYEEIMLRQKQGKLAPQVTTNPVYTGEGIDFSVNAVDEGYESFINNQVSE